MCRGDEITHRHHIIPRYMGGTDIAENLVEVSITQHAIFHYCNYQLWKNEEDKIAWKMLGGQITAGEAYLEARKLGGKRGSQKIKEKYQNPEVLKVYKEKCKEAFYNSPNREYMIERAKINQPKATEAAKKPESNRKRKQTLSAIKHQQGEKNSQYGSMWITNETKEGTYKINKNDPIPEGYRKGRVCK
jgi:hypothetical protein